jgi:hypothetical protein
MTCPHGATSGAGWSTRQVITSTNTSTSAGTTVHATSMARGGDALPSGRCARARNADRTIAACDSAQHAAAAQKIASVQKREIVGEI